MIEPRAAAAAPPRIPLIEESASVLFRFTDRLYRASAARDVHDAALDAITEALQCERAAVLLADAQGVMRFVAWRGLSEGYRAAVEGHSPWKAGDPDPAPVCVHDVAAAGLEPGLKAVVLAEGIRRLCFIPLMAERRLIGKFMAYFDEPNGFGQAEEELALLIGRQLSFGIERLQSEQRRQQAREALLREQRNKDAFLAVLGHELRNPLAPILLAVERLQRLPSPQPEVRECAGVIRRQARVLTRLVDDLLDLTRISQGKIELRWQVTATRALVDGAVDMSRAFAVARRQDLVCAVSPAVPQLRCDPLRMTQVLANLLNNACKYSPEGASIALGVDADDADILIRVRDDGAGIAPDFLPKVFDMYAQGAQARSQPSDGLGIGLHLVRHLVELHGGSAHAHSDGPGKGSVFTLRLPRAACDPSGCG